MREMSNYMKWYWGMTPEKRNEFNAKRSKKQKPYRAKYYQENRLKEMVNSAKYKKTIKGRDVARKSSKKYYYKHRDWYIGYYRQSRIKDKL